MSQNTNQHHDISNGDKSQNDSHGGRRWAKAGAAVVAVGALAVAGISFAASASECHEHSGMERHGNMDPAKMAKHIDRMVNHVLRDGTPEQKAKLHTIITAAMTDLKPLHEQRRADRKQVMSLLTQAAIDRGALEKLRVHDMQLADQASKRITQAMEDAVEVLTPEQRVKLAEHLKKRMD